MDDPVVEVQCDKCGNSFAIKASDYEKAMQNDQPILCDVCFDFLFEEQQKANKPTRRKFEYVIVSIAGFANKYGEEGWELVAVYNGVMYFKRELLEA